MTVSEFRSEILPDTAGSGPATSVSAGTPSEILGRNSDGSRPPAVWWLALVVAGCGAVATAHGLFDVVHRCGVAVSLAWLWVPITDGLALVAYACTPRLRGAARWYAWAVVVVCAGLSGLAQAVNLAGLGDPDWRLKFGVGYWPAVAVAVAAHLLWLVAEAGRAEPEPEPVTEPAQGEPLYEPVLTERPEGAEAAVYRLYDAEGSLLYVGCTVDPWTRLRAHRRRQPWWDEVVSAELIWFPSVDLAADVEQQAIGTERPVYNIALNRYANHVRDVPEAAPVVAGPSSRELNSGRQRESLVECTCGLAKCSGWVGRSTRTRHRKQAKDAAGRAARAGQNGHRDPVSVG